MNPRFTVKITVVQYDDATHEQERIKATRVQTVTASTPEAAIAAVCGSYCNCTAHLGWIDAARAGQRE